MPIPLSRLEPGFSCLKLSPLSYSQLVVPFMEFDQERQDAVYAAASTSVFAGQLELGRAALTTAQDGPAYLENLALACASYTEIITGYS